MPHNWQLQLISVAFEHSVLCVWEIYALENAVFCIAVYGPYAYKPYISCTECSNATEIDCTKLANFTTCIFSVQVNT